MIFLINILKAVLWGILEGFTDFIPIGRTGHIALFDSLWTMYPLEFFEVFKTMARLGALIAVFSICKDQWNVFDLKKEKTKTIRLWINFILGTLPLIVVGFFLYDFIYKRLNSNLVIGVTMIIMGFIILFVDKKKGKKIENVSFKKTFQIGLFQCLALIPGCSLSTSRIIGALHTGFSRQASAKYNLLLGMPILLIAIIVQSVKYILTYSFFSFAQCIYLVVGICASFIVSYIMIKFFLNYTKKHSYHLFGLYQMFLGLFILIYFYIL